MIDFIQTYKTKQFYSKIISKNDLCFDIGANRGRKSKILLSLGAKVIAFEPQSSCHKYLNEIKNKRFSYYPLAVGEKREFLDLHLSNHSEVATLSSAFVKYYHSDTIYWDKTERVEVCTLNDLINIHGIPNYCKVDVEGHELSVFSTLKYPIPLIEFEFTGGFIADTLSIIDLLAINNSVRFNFIRNENPSFILEEWIDGPELKKIISSLSIPNLHGNIFVKSNS